MKVAILTINDYTNYGNRLQNYAVQEVLKNLGVETLTIINTTRHNNFNENKNMFSKYITKINTIGINGIVRKIIFRIKGIDEKKLKSSKEINFREFSKLYISESELKINEGNIPTDIGRYFDYFITGSDQVWNPNFIRFSEVDFLTFVPKEKRIAYAPSFGVSSIPVVYKEDFKKWIDGMNSLSVREYAGAKLIKDLTGRTAEVLVDPTMMISRDNWLNISKVSSLKPKNAYLCTYFLGETYEAHKNSVLKIAKSKNLEVVNLGSLYDSDRYSIDPSEFLDYIASSELFMTDSFHGTIFSIIFEKPFIVYDRVSKLQSMNSRIDTLLTKFNMMERKWESVKQSQDYFGADFSQTGPIFEYERSKAYKYLIGALDLEDDK